MSTQYETGPNVLNRRTTLRAAGGSMAALGALLAGGRVAAADGESAPAVAGVWLVTATAMGAPPAPLFNLFTPEGIVISVPPDLTRSILIGLWIQTGEREYGNTFYNHRFDTNGMLIGRAKIQTRIQLDESGDTFRGAFKATMFDLNGAVVLTREGTQEATRLLAEPFS
jgi:hypothetical protein